MRFSSLILFVLLIPFCHWSQHQRLENYKNFDKALMQFGVQMGMNNASFNLIPIKEAYSLYGYRSIQAKSQPGLTIGMLTSIKLGSPVLRLRIIPTFSFQERVINYYSSPKIQEGKEEFNEERINSSNVDLPVLLQFRTLRYGNFTSYFIGGGQYSIDLQSTVDKTQNLVDPFIKLQKKYWMGQAGIGVEFFAEYFKFGMEIKYSQGFQNVLIQDNSAVSNPLQSLRNNAWIFTITFEGGL
jgi:hypothetical protein